MKLFKVREPEPVDMSFFEHLDALRPRLMRSAAALFIFMIAAFLAKEWLMAIIMGPKSEWFPTNRLFAWLSDLMNTDVLRINARPMTLINTTMAGQFNLHLSLAFHTALLLAVPYMLWELWGFVKPALSPFRAAQQPTVCIAGHVLFLYGCGFRLFPAGAALDQLPC